MSSATANFVSSDVGQRVRVSYATGIVPATIASVTNSTTAIMSAAATGVNQMGATIHIGQGYGVGIYNGQGSNQDKNQIIQNVQIDDCARGVDVEGGNVQIFNISGGTNDVGVYFGGGSEVSVIADDQSEGNLQALYEVNLAATVVYRESRMNTTAALADGFFYFAGGGRFSFLLNNSLSTPPKNSVLFGFGGVPTAPVIFSAGNNLQPLTLAEINYNAVDNLSVNSDTIGSNDTISLAIGYPTSCSGITGTGQLANVSGAVTIC